MVKLYNMMQSAINKGVDMNNKSMFAALILFMVLSLKSYAIPVEYQAGEFLNKLSQVVGNKAIIEGKNGSRGLPCKIEIIKGTGRSSGFQTVLKITETNYLGSLKPPVQINVLHMSKGLYGMVSAPEGKIHHYQFVNSGILYEIGMVESSPRFALELKATMNSKAVSSYCFVPSL